MRQDNTALTDEQIQKREELDAILEAAAAFRYKYVNLAMASPFITRTFKELSDEFDPEEIPQVISALIRLISSDIAGSTPYIPISQMKNIIDYLNQLKVIASLYNKVGILLEKTEMHYGVVAAETKDIIIPVLRLKDERLINPQQIKHRMPFLVSANPSKDIMLIQGIANIVRRDLPHKAFPTLENRESLIAAIQGLLDDAINREERMLHR